MIYIYIYIYIYLSAIYLYVYIYIYIFMFERCAFWAPPPSPQLPPPNGMGFKHKDL